MMLFGEREDDFPEIDLLDNQSKKNRGHEQVRDHHRCAQRRYR